jgi:pyrroline-5-carboxylate reductase
MPNTPALVGAGATAIAVGSRATPADAARARELFQSVGLCLQVEEQHLDAVTGLSGSGPAYVLRLLEAMTQGGAEVGLPADVAHELAVQTLLGTARLVLETGEAPTVLRERVTSPGGTTVAGLAALQSGDFYETVIAAVRDATARSRELGGNQGRQTGTK